MSTRFDDVRTERLRLRAWTERDLEPFAAINSDPRVMEHFPKLQSRAESDASADRIRGHWATHGFGLWAIEIPGEVAFAGYVGLSRPTFEAAFTPCVEIGWRIAADCWGHGYATEGARAALRVGFVELALDEIVSFTVPANQRSLRVMDKLGLRHDPSADFDHPRIPAGHPLQRHVLFRLRRDAWRP
jgi:RimJ/RimL family protein N-acetyltransferase